MKERKQNLYTSGLHLFLPSVSSIRGAEEDGICWLPNFVETSLLGRPELALEKKGVSWESIARKYLKKSTQDTVHPTRLLDHLSFHNPALPSLTVMIQFARARSLCSNRVRLLPLCSVCSPELLYTPHVDSDLKQCSGS